MRGFYGVFSGSGGKSMSKKPKYQDLVDILTRIWKTTRVESVLSVEWANYPVEVFDELTNVIMELELEDE